MFSREKVSAHHSKGTLFLPSTLALYIFWFTGKETRLWNAQSFPHWNFVLPSVFIYCLSFWARNVRDPSLALELKCLGKSAWSSRKTQTQNHYKNHKQKTTGEDCFSSTKFLCLSFVQVLFHSREILFKGKVSRTWHQTNSKSVICEK